MAKSYLATLVLFFVFAISTDISVAADVKCGLRAAVFDKTLLAKNVSHARIVGGSAVPTSGSAWPWMVSIANSDIPEVRLCGGALISPFYVLTAAHCFKYFEQAKWQVELARYDAGHPESYTIYRGVEKV